ncbi:hypothetical protein IQ255_29335 [Pleurocapsales cyanobacterium LEGE 10410]|nr:hypothetical protein [Pleurocapsales cyanobacterium LEGE 10410]
MKKYLLILSLVMGVVLSHLFISYEMADANIPCSFEYCNTNASEPYCAANYNSTYCMKISGADGECHYSYPCNDPGESD